jgi:hypothetical protein
MLNARPETYRFGREITVLTRLFRESSSDTVVLHWGERIRDDRFGISCKVLTKSFTTFNSRDRSFDLRSSPYLEPLPKSLRFWLTLPNTFPVVCRHYLLVDKCVSLFFRCA